MRKFYGAILFLLIILFSVNANAGMMKYIFEGDVVYAFDHTGTIDFTSVDTYFGEIVYDTSIVDTVWDPTWGEYPDAIQEFTVTLGSSVFSLDSAATNRIKLVNRQWDIIHFQGDAVGPSTIGTIDFDLELTDQNGTAFASDALPMFLDFSDFFGSERLILGSSTSDFFVNGTELTKFELAPAPVPEPATMLLLGIGLVGLTGFGRKRFKK